MFHRQFAKFPVAPVALVTDRGTAFARDLDLPAFSGPLPEETRESRGKVGRRSWCRFEFDAARSEADRADMVFEFHDKHEVAVPARMLDDVLERPKIRWWRLPVIGRDET